MIHTVKKGPQPNVSPVTHMVPQNGVLQIGLGSQRVKMEGDILSDLILLNIVVVAQSFDSGHPDSRSPGLNLTRAGIFLIIIIIINIIYIF